MAAGEGFEPSQTESESGVLPLHKPAIATAARYTQRTNVIIQEVRNLSTPFFKKVGKKKNAFAAAGHRRFAAVPLDRTQETEV